MKLCPSCGAPASSLGIVFRSAFRCPSCGAVSRVTSLPTSWTAAAMVLGAGSAMVMKPEPLWIRVVMAAALSVTAVAFFTASQCVLVADDARSQP